MREHAVILGSLVSCLGSAGYVRDTLRGTTSPNRATFLLWTVAPLIAFAAQVRAGVGWSSLTTLTSGLLPGMVLLASFAHRGLPWRLGWFDYGCGTLSLLALVLWRISGSGEVAIAFSILADLLAALPTLVKAWRHPQTETASAYWCACFSAFCGMVALQSSDFSAVAFPLYLLLVTGVIGAVIVVPRGRGQLTGAPVRGD